MDIRFQVVSQEAVDHTLALEAAKAFELFTYHRHLKMALPFGARPDMTLMERRLILYN